MGENGKKFRIFERAEVLCLPATPFTVARFMAFRFKEGAQGTKGTISAAILAMYQAAGYKSPIHNKVVEWVKRGIEKCRRWREKTKLFEIEWLKKWRVGGWKEYGVSEFRWMRESAIIALGIRMIQRPDDLSNLNVGDVEFGKGAMWVKIRSSKADQEGVGHVVPIDATDNLDMCVMMIMGEYLSVRGGEW
jgi:integrase